MFNCCAILVLFYMSVHARPNLVMARCLYTKAYSSHQAKGYGLHSSENKFLIKLLSNKVAILMLGGLDMYQSHLCRYLLGICCLCGLQLAHAITPDVNDQTGYNREFRLLDVDANDKLSAKEASKDPVFGSTGFARADRNRNHALDKEEFATYKSAVQQKQAKQAASDSAITAKIKSKYLVEKNFRSFRVSVETKDSVVVLSGFVENEFTRKRAEQIAYEVSGVKAVKNALVVKP